MTVDSWIERANKLFLPVFKRLPVEIQRGQGVYLYDRQGRAYLDFFSGLGVNALGYGHPKIWEAIEKQLQRNLHLSNYFVQDVQVELAEKLLRFSNHARLFLTNSGTESIEGCLKIVKKWANQHAREKIICFKNAFHGRTLGALSVTAQEKYQKSFLPLLGGIEELEYNDSAQLERAIDDRTAAVILEFIQGEGGVVPATEDFISTLAGLKSEYNFLLVADEIQTGVGRTGRFFAYQHHPLVPDLVATAKAIGGGLPLGAFLVSEDLAAVLEPGEHGTTFGGNPLSCAAGLAVLDEYEGQHLQKHVAEMGNYLAEGLRQLKKQFPEKVVQVRGVGLMQALVLQMDAFPYVLQGLRKGIILNATAGNVLRFLPPLIIAKQEIDQGIQILKALLADEVH